MLFPRCGALCAIGCAVSCRHRENFRAYAGDPTVNKDRCIVDSWRTTAYDAIEIWGRFRRTCGTWRAVHFTATAVTCACAPGRSLYRARRSSIAHARISIADEIDLGFPPINKARFRNTVNTLRGASRRYCRFCVKIENAVVVRNRQRTITRKLKLTWRRIRKKKK